MEYAYIIAGSSAACATTAVLYKYIRPKFPVKVNCWFCQTDVVVPFGNQNCWDCPHCDQYNGFTSDGDYNKAIPSQYFEDMNHPPPAEHATSTSPDKDIVLCEKCTRNQTLKVKQLANFLPYSEANYDAEVSSYRRHLESVYRLCRLCELKVTNELQKQQRIISQKYNIEPAAQNSFNQYSSARPMGSLNNSISSSLCTSHIICRMSTPWHVKLLRWTSVLCVLTLLLTSVHMLLIHSDLQIQYSALIPRVLSRYLHSVYDSSTTLVLLGFFTSVMAIFLFGKTGVHMCDAINCFSWVLLVVTYLKRPSLHFIMGDQYFIQGAVSALASVLAVWGCLCHRYENSSRKRITKKGRVYDSVPNSANSSPAPSVREEVPEREERRPRDEVLDNLETMSIGKPARSPPKPGIFQPFNAQVNSQYSSPVSSGLRQRGQPLIKPARFTATSKPHHTKPNHQLYPPNNNGGVFGHFQNRNPTNSLFGGSSYVTAASLQAHNSSYDGFSQGPIPDDRASLFSQHRHQNKHYEDDSASEVSNESRITDDLPPGTSASCLLQQQPHPAHTKRSVLTQVIIGLSIGLNISIVLYFIVDLKSLLKL